MTILPPGLDPQLREYVHLLPDLDMADIASARRTMSEMTAALPPYRPRVPLTIEDRTVPGWAGDPDVAVRVYSPAAGDRAQPAVLYIHGGGFVMGDLETDHGWAAKMAATVGAVVVSVDYRLAPEFPYPAAVDDCYAALTWITGPASKDLGVDLDRVAVSGTSAGANLAAAVALRARDQSGPALCFQQLAIPQLDDRGGSPSQLAFTDSPFWTAGKAAATWKHYLGKGAGGADTPAYASPARADDLAGLPPAYVYVCEFDPLRDEGLDYARRLLEAGVSTEIHLYPGTFHSSGVITGAAVSRRTNADTLAALSRALGTDS
ncbi:MAG: alpha/beta hydrolase [Candidatus Dormibacteria bacterium]